MLAAPRKAPENLGVGAAERRPELTPPSQAGWRSHEGRWWPAARAWSLACPSVTETSPSRRTTPGLADVGVSEGRRRADVGVSEGRRRASPWLGGAGLRRPSCLPPSRKKLEVQAGVGRPQAGQVSAALHVHSRGQPGWGLTSDDL